MKPLTAALLAYLAAVNAITFAVYGADKRRAKKGKRRVPEKTLFLLAAVGGSPAILINLIIGFYMGLSTGAGVALALAPLPLLCALVFWVVLFLTTRYVSVASIAAAVGLPVFAFVFRFFNIGNASAKSMPVLIFFCAIAAITVYRHRSNIKRLLEGTENRFEKKH